MYYSRREGEECILYSIVVILVAALGLPGWMGLDKSAAIAIVLGCILLTTALATAYKLYHCRRNRDLRNDEMRTANTGQYHGKYLFSSVLKITLKAHFTTFQIEADLIFRSLTKSKQKPCGKSQICKYDDVVVK